MRTDCRESREEEGGSCDIQGKPSFDLTKIIRMINRVTLEVRYAFMVVPTAFAVVLIMFMKERKPE